MPFRKQLKSSQPQAFGKNALLQKQYERLYNRLERERKSTQRRIQVTEEKCVHSIYSLLQEAETYEQDKRRKQEEEEEKRIKKEGKTPVFFYEIENEYEPKQPETKTVRGRPMTASVSTRIKSADRRDLSTRPSSAGPALSVDRRGSVSTASVVIRGSSADRSNRRSSNASSCDSIKKDRKWDLKDNEQYTKDIRVIRDIGPPPYKRLDSKTGEAELKTKSFIQKYSGQYRSLLRPETAPILETRAKRNEKISRQEMASINADTAKYKKNTRMLLLKSREIKLYVENLPGVDKTQIILDT